MRQYLKVCKKATEMGHELCNFLIFGRKRRCYYGGTNKKREVFDSMRNGCVIDGNMNVNDNEKGIIDAVTIETEIGRYSYVLIREESITADACGTGRKVARVAYSLMALLFANGEEPYGEYVFDISSDIGTAKRIFLAVANGIASPVTVRDLIEDMIAEF